MVFKTVEGLKDAVSAEEHTVKGKKVKAASPRFCGQTMYMPSSFLLGHIFVIH